MATSMEYPSELNHSEFASRLKPGIMLRNEKAARAARNPGPEYRSIHTRLRSLRTASRLPAARPSSRKGVR